MRMEYQDICFTHSLPYDSIRAFYEPVDTGSVERAIDIFRHTPYRIIFCGHSHLPILFRWRSGRVFREEIQTNKKIFLDPSERYIIIVGSVDSREYGFFDWGKMCYERIRKDNTELTEPCRGISPTVTC